MSSGPVSDSSPFPNEQVTVEQLAAALGMSKWTVHYHIREGHIPVNRNPMGGSRVYINTVDRDVAERLVTNYRRNKRWSTGDPNAEDN